jgi:hypothetical protein
LKEPSVSPEAAQQEVARREGGHRGGELSGWFFCVG